MNPGRSRSLWLAHAGLLAATLVLASATAPTGLSAADPAARRWKEDELVASYTQLKDAGLENAVRTPALPKDPPSPAFLEALAWYSAGTPDKPGVLTVKQLDKQIDLNVASYLRLLKAKAESGAENDYVRTRVWKVIQKQTMLRAEMTQPARGGSYAYAAMPLAATDPGADAWDREHTLQSPEEFVAKVCRAPQDRPVLVKFGNTNCTQCMLFEIIGSVKEFAQAPAHKDSIDVYKVWFGYRPDASFAGRIHDPGRLEALAKAEGVTSSPTFVVYRNGRRYPCGDGFPDKSGEDARLETCLKQDFGEGAVAGICEPGAVAAAPAKGGR